MEAFARLKPHPKQQDDNQDAGPDTGDVVGRTVVASIEEFLVLPALFMDQDPDDLPTAQRQEASGSRAVPVPRRTGARTREIEAAVWTGRIDRGGPEREPIRDRGWEGPRIGETGRSHWERVVESGRRRWNGTAPRRLKDVGGDIDRLPQQVAA